MHLNIDAVLIPVSQRTEVTIVIEYDSFEVIYSVRWIMKLIINYYESYAIKKALWKHH